ncbi:hypothetical protein CRENBAI_020035 [Crenichthys baileyi]|uniref:Uncharacterized protein n=1 Tax=Crenichthys baileyi TaxID=28760 RepID=A0AAV9S445_9TELE
MFQSMLSLYRNYALGSDRAPGVMENPGYSSGSFDGLHHPSDDDDDEMVDIAGATLDFSSTDDVPSQLRWGL